jgi:hypothetical protein
MTISSKLKLHINLKITQIEPTHERRHAQIRENIRHATYLHVGEPLTPSYP